MFCLCIMLLFLSLHRICPQAVDLSKPIDKRIYKGTQPTCHDFNQYSATAESVALIVGFSAGQVQYLDPIKKETSKLFNEEVLLGSFFPIFVAPVCWGKVVCLALFDACMNSEPCTLGVICYFSIFHPCWDVAMKPETLSSVVFH